MADDEKKPATIATTVTWKQGMAVDAELDGHRFGLDADAEFGGTDHGPRPKGLVLTALAGCTALDVIAIAGKMKVPFDTFSVDVEATLTTTHPKVFDRIRLNYRFTGPDLVPDKLQRSVMLSQEKYCGVSAMLRPVAQLSRAIFLNGELHCEKDDPPPIAAPT